MEQGQDFRRDSYFLNRRIDLPKVQIFSSEEIIEDPAKETFFCTMCKGVLDYDKYLEVHVCKSCVQYYDTTNLQDKPLKDIKDFQLVPYGEQMHYATFDENDPMTPFVENVPLDDFEDNNDLVATRTYDQGRIQHIKVKGSFADAIAFSNAISAKKKSEEFD